MVGKAHSVGEGGGPLSTLNACPSAGYADCSNGRLPINNPGATGVTPSFQNQRFASLAERTPNNRMLLTTADSSPVLACHPGTRVNTSSVE